MWSNMTLFRLVNKEERGWASLHPKSRTVVDLISPCKQRWYETGYGLRFSRKIREKNIFNILSLKNGFFSEESSRILLKVFILAQTKALLIGSSKSEVPFSKFHPLSVYVQYLFSLSIMYNHAVRGLEIFYVPAMCIKGE